MSTSHDDAWIFSGFAFPTTTPIPDQVFDELLHRLSGNELKVLLYICRRTYGFKKERDTISLSQMVTGITTRDGRILDHGTGLSKATVARCLNTLEEKNIILRMRQSSQERGDEPTTYALNMLTPTAPPLSQNETGGVSAVRQGGVSAVRQGGVSVVRQGGVSAVRHTINSSTTNSSTTNRTTTTRQAESNGQETSVPRTTDVVVALVDLGISQTVAKRLVNQYSEKQIREKIDFLGYLQEVQPDKVSNARGWLRKAIEEDYGPPDGYMPAEERQAEAEREQERQEELLQQAQESQRRRQRKDSATPEDEIWQKLMDRLKPANAGIAELLQGGQLRFIDSGKVEIGVPNERARALLSEHEGTNRVVRTSLADVLDASVELDVTVLARDAR